jgi:hypothetical protein
MSSTYKNARVEWAETSQHATVALRVDNQISHFCNFENQMGLMIAIAAGLQGKTVDFTTDGEAHGQWQNVRILAVN